MPKRTDRRPGALSGLAALAPLLAALALLAAGCARQPALSLAQVELGEFSGQGAAELRGALAALTPAGGRGERRLVLSGATKFDYSSRDGSETVTVSDRYDSRWPEGLAGWDEVPKKDPRYKTSQYPATMTEASLSVDWSLTDSRGGGVVASGTTASSFSRSYGGFMESQGRDGEGPPDREGALGLLSKSLAARLAQQIGPDYGPAYLASGKDAMSRRASSLAGTGDWDGAAAVWLEILGLNPEHGPSLYNLGLYHERRGDLDKAFAYYRLAFLSSQIRPYRLALTRISDTLEKLGRLPQAAPPRPF